MSVVTPRTRVTKRHEYAVPQPAAYGDVEDAILWAKRDAQAAHVDTSYSDALHVTHDDDNIIVYWEQEVADV
ncbi:hypothetical protein FBY30_2764 [Arthrobacter sp. SLBN-83]|uniref:hypothetical protein n=1 Tax=Arthrobacter sp. SLBN-83 TaxID=2768449 RepID=UPI001151C00F|nr:hypothetical protein [Arthrobacter sp. SLBN-83]TQJ60496.1 hypothetical protein FBY30_2764 [Arthrobacter sp. SLBN-83]